MVFYVLVVLHILPIWLFKYIPTQDGPSHVYNSFVLKEYHNPDYSVLEQHYTVDVRPFSNWLSHVTMAMLMFIVSPLIAEKLLLTGYVILFAFAIQYFLGAVNRRKTLLSIVGLLFVYNRLLHWGFYNFCFSVPLYLIAIAYWWRHKDVLDVRRIVVLNLIVIATYFCHLGSVVLAVASIFFLSIVTCHRDIIRKRLLTFVYLIPSYVLPIYFLAGNAWHSSGEPVRTVLTEPVNAAGIGKWAISGLKYLVTCQSVVSFSPTQLWIGKMLMFLFFLLAGYTLLEAIRKKELLRCLRHPFFLLFLILCVGFSITPETLLGAVRFRLAMYPSLVLLAWLSQDWSRAHHRFEKAWQNSLRVVVVLLVAVNLCLTIHYYKRLNVDIAEFTSGVDVVEPNKTILPLSFDHIGDAYRIWTFVHTSAYYALSQPGVDLGNYEAVLGWFPVNFRKELCRPSLGTIEEGPHNLDVARYVDVVDYIVTWCMPTNSDVADRIDQYYEMIFENGRLRIFGRRASLTGEIEGGGE
jgi:hypothetical protein